MAHATIKLTHTPETSWTQNYSVTIEWAAGEAISPKFLDEGLGWVSHIKTLKSGVRRYSHKKTTSKTMDEIKAHVTDWLDLMNQPATVS